MFVRRDKPALERRPRYYSGSVGSLKSTVNLMLP
jgi:hypothetical protein